MIDWSGIDISPFTHLKAWVDRMLQRPGVEKGRNVPEPHLAFEREKLSEEELEAKAAKAREWIIRGMNQDAKK